MSPKTAFHVYQAVTIVGIGLFVIATGLVHGWPKALGVAGILLVGFGLCGSHLAHMARYR